MECAGLSLSTVTIIGAVVCLLGTIFFAAVAVYGFHEEMWRKGDWSWANWVVFLSMVGVATGGALATVEFVRDIVSAWPVS